MTKNRNDRPEDFFEPLISSVIACFLWIGIFLAMIVLFIPILIFDFLNGNKKPTRTENKSNKHK